MENEICRWIITVIVSVTAAMSAAQSRDEIESRMDMIKLDESFIYGEAYTDNKDIAFQNALNELLYSVNELRSEKNLDPLNASALLPVMKELRYSFEGRHLSFLYLPVNQTLSLSSVSTPEYGGYNRTTAESSIAAVEISIKEVKKQAAVPPEDYCYAHTSSPKHYEGILHTLCGQGNWVEIKGFLKEYKANGKIKQIGKCNSRADVPEDAYSILLDDMGGIISILSPASSSVRMDHKTNMPYNEAENSNIKFIVWYK